MDVTPSQVQRWLDPFEFAKPREVKEADARVSIFAEEKPEYVKTEDIDASLRLLTGAYERLETIEGNLKSMLDLANEASLSRRISDSKREEIYAQLRSLSAGIDILADQTRYDELKILDGSKVELADGSGAPTTLTIGNMATSGLDSLLISRKERAGIGTVFYDEAVLERNSRSTLVGLDISEVNSVRPQAGMDELEDGNYTVKITYAGPDSTIELLDETNNVLGKQENVDLSGTGQELVNLGVGVQLSIEKENQREALGVELFDKYDYRSYGPTELYAKLNYQRVLTHNLDAGHAPAPKRASLSNSTEAVTANGAGNLYFGGVAMAEPQNGRSELAEGRYTVEVRYNGETSNLFLRDANGRLIDAKTRVDLSNSGLHNVRFDSGPNVTLVNNAFTESRGSFSSTLEVRSDASKAPLVAEFASGARGRARSETGELNFHTTGIGNPAPGKQLVEAGDYRIEVSYLGKYSTALLRDARGNMIDVQANIDLSDGKTTEIAFDNGLKLSVKNESFGDERVRFQGTVRVSDDEGAAPQASDPYSIVTDRTVAEDSGGQLAVTGSGVAGVQKGEAALASGKYRVELAYYGASSMAWLRDPENNLLAVQTGIDLTSGDIQKVDFGNGLTVDVQSARYTTTGGRSFAEVEIQTGEREIAAFDFEEYADSIGKALEFVQEQMKLVDDTYFEINQVQGYRQLADPVQSGQVQFAKGAGTIQLLAQNIDSSVNSLLFPQATGASVNIFNAQVFTAINLPEDFQSQVSTQVPALDLLNLQARNGANSLFGAIAR